MEMPKLEDLKFVFHMENYDEEYFQTDEMSYEGARAYFDSTVASHNEWAACPPDDIRYIAVLLPDGTECSYEPGDYDEWENIEAGLLDDIEWHLSHQK